MENLPLVVFRATRAGRLLDVGAGASVLLGFDRADLLHEGVAASILNPEDRALVTHALRQAEAEGQAAVRVQLHRKDGVACDVEIHFTVSEETVEGVVYFLRSQPETAEGVRLRSRYDDAEPALRNAALAGTDVLAFLESAVGLLGHASRADRAHVLLAGAGESLLSVAFWSRPATRRPDPLELDPALWPELAAGRVLRITTQESEPARDLIRHIGCGEVVLVPFRDDADRDGAFLLEMDEPSLGWGSFESGSLARFARLFETLWAWLSAEARYRNTLADLDDGLFNFAFDSEGHRHYAFVTPQFERITGCRARDLLPEGEKEPNVRWPELVAEEDRTLFEEHEASLRNGERSKIEFRITRPDTRAVHWLRESATPSFSPSGRSVVGGLVSDITERKRAEISLLQAKQAAEQTSRAKTVFMATMSHEIRSPLGAIHGFADLLSQEVLELQKNGPAPPEQIAEFAGAILENSKRVLHLIRNLFDLSQLEAGGFDLGRVEVPLNPAIERVLDVYRTAAEGKSIELAFEHADGDPVLLGDPERIEQIVDHLISNAVKFTGTGGSVRVQTRIDGPDAILRVEDTGVGIAPEYVEKLFEPFSQEDYRLNRAYDGSGLGLAITKTLLDAMGASIRVESVKGKGSCFEVTFRPS